MFRNFLFFAMWVLCASMMVNAQEFSADVVDLKPENSSVVRKLYVGSDAVRLEGHSGEGHTSALIEDFGRHKRYMIMPQNQVYLELSLAQPTQGFSFWRPSDAEKVCSEWDNVEKQFQSPSPLSNCKKLGTETLNGRETIRHQGSSADGKTGYAWIDPKIRYLVKLEGPEGAGRELSNVQEGAQPATLFELPKDYTKMETRQPRSKTQPARGQHTPKAQQPPKN
jgi:hypothetical protein